MDPNNGRDVLETIARRERVVDALASGRARKRDLVDALDVSRSTVDRAVRDLELASLVDRDGTRYQLTVTGRLAVDAYRRSVGTFEAITSMSDVLELIPEEESLSPVVFDGAKTATLPVDGRIPEPAVHERFVDRIVDWIEQSERVVGFSPVEPNPRIRELLAARTAAGELDAEILISPSLTRYLLEEHSSQLREMIESDGLTLGEVDTLPYGLGIYEALDRTCVLVFVYGDTARIRGLIENDTAGAIAWAWRTYGDFRERATILENDP